MGALLSNLLQSQGESGSSDWPSLGDIPESCVACVFKYLTPPEICSLAHLNRVFYGASTSDYVWESKLPPNYQRLLQFLLPQTGSQNLCKKDIFSFLSKHIQFDDGNKEIWLDKVSGGVCVAIAAKSMAITGIEDRRYWNWTPTDESRFHSIASLLQIWWFEVDGAIKFPFPAGIYTLSFRFHLGRFSRRLGRRVCSFEHTHGWDIKPVKFELSTSDGQQVTRECFLDEPEKDCATGNHKRGCWIEYEVGEFIVNDSEMLEVRFSMKQIDCTHSKGGICVDSVLIVPSHLRKEGKGSLEAEISKCL